MNRLFSNETAVCGVCKPPIIAIRQSVSCSNLRNPPYIRYLPAISPAYPLVRKPCGSLARIPTTTVLNGFIVDVEHYRDRWSARPGGQLRATHGSDSFRLPISLSLMCLDNQSDGKITHSFERVRRRVGLSFPPVVLATRVWRRKGRTPFVRTLAWCPSKVVRPGKGALVLFCLRKERSASPLSLFLWYD